MLGHTTFLNRHYQPSVSDIVNIHIEITTEIEQLISRHIYCISELNERVAQLTNIIDFCIKYPAYHELQDRARRCLIKINSYLKDFSNEEHTIIHDEIKSSSVSATDNIQFKESTKIIFSFLSLLELVQAKKVCRLWSASANETVLKREDLITTNKTIINLSHLSKKPNLSQLNSSINQVLNSKWEKMKFWKTSQDKLSLALENLEMKNQTKIVS